MGSTAEIDEKQRLSAVRRLRLLDTPEASAFDSITEIAASALGCPVALISLVDERRQWFKSSFGINLSETPREISFCTHAIERDELFWVQDARIDPRFKCSPLVTEPPHFAFYAGKPIRSPEGYLVGTLCALDTVSRDLTSQQAQILANLARTVDELIAAHVNNLELNRLNDVLAEESKQFARANRVFQHAEKVANIGSWEVELPEFKLRWSNQVYAIHERSVSDPIGFEEGMYYYVPEDLPRIRETLSAAIDSDERFEVEATIVTAAGNLKRVRSMGERFGSDNEPQRIVGVIQDITEQYQTTLSLKNAAERDSLTGLYNRYAFDRILNEKIGAYRQNDDHLFLVLVDLDGFKDVNDVFGHLVGDVVLEEVSRRIAKAAPPGSVLARWGGDEFALIIWAGMTTADISVLVDSIISAISENIPLCDQNIRVGATCGISEYQGSDKAERLIQKADLALYHGKHRESGSQYFYRPEFELENQSRQRAITQVDDALKNDRIFAAYQPIFDLENGATIGLEALVRLRTDRGSVLTASEVMPGLLDPTLSRKIADSMVQKICRDHARLFTAESNLRYVSLNATESDLLSRDLPMKLLATLSSSGVSPEQVTLEVTETMLLVNDVETVRSVLHRLSAAGMSIALDDFGTGFSSLTHLRDFPIDQVKIDRSFISEITRKHDSRLIVQALLGMARNLGITVVAEGVETAEQRRLLLQMGCHYGQGFLASPAVTLEHFEAMAREPGLLGAPVTGEAA